MRVLAHIHTFNEATFIQQALDGLQRQTRSPDAIVIVDNGSTDGTLDRTFPETVTVIRNPADLGTCGSVGVGFAHALKHKCDWIWVLDADSVPEPSALENLLAFFERMPPEEREEVCFLSCRLATGSSEAEHRPIILTASCVKWGSLDLDIVLAANDGLLLASMVEAVLMVVGAGSANVDEIRRDKEQLDAIGTPIIGVVLNRFEPKVHGRSNQPYRGYYRRARR